VMLAAGAIAIERLTQYRTFLRVPAVVIPIMLILPLLPFSIPVLSPEKLTDYAATFTEQTGVDAFHRWEDGKIHELPQDFADMLGWKEIATLAAKAYYEIPVEERKNTIILAEHYGQAGAIDFYKKEFNLPQVYSFSSSYLLWLPQKFTAKKVIFINNNLHEDIQKTVGKQTLIGEITDKYSRQNGNKVWLLEDLSKEYYALYENAINEERAFFE